MKSVRTISIYESFYPSENENEKAGYIEISAFQPCLWIMECVTPTVKKS